MSTSEHNPDYKSNKSTSVGLKDRKKTSPPPPPSTSTSSSDSTTSIPYSSDTNNQQNNADFEEILNRYKDEARLEIAQHVGDIQNICKMTKTNLLNKISQNAGCESYEWVKDVLGEKATQLSSKSPAENLLLFNILTVFHDIVDEITCSKQFLAKDVPKSA